MTDVQMATQTMTQPAIQLQPPSTPSPHPTFDNLGCLPASEALRLLSASLELLVHITGDVPPTPPPRTPTDPQMSGLIAEKENIRRSRQNSPARPPTTVPQSEIIKSNVVEQPQQIDGVRLKTGGIVIGEDVQSLAEQHGAITRKFYSKAEPPISITQYLARLHQFIPMSTAVYLATSLYIHRLAIEQRAIPVTRKNAHRLVLAALRVATKALEDLAYPHRKVARVGGVSEAELARLEISFCFLAGFELVVGEERLTRHWRELEGRREMGIVQLGKPTKRGCAPEG